MVFTYLLSAKKEEREYGDIIGVAKDKLLAVNGFDEDYQTAGVGEDVDIECACLLQD